LDERLAKNAARAVDHHLDWTFEYYSKVDSTRLLGANDLNGFREKVFAQCSELRMMNDLADAAHHRFLTRKPESRIITTSTDAFESREDTLWVLHFDRSFQPALQAAVDFWRRWPD